MTNKTQRLLGIVLLLVIISLPVASAFVAYKLGYSAGRAESYGDAFAEGIEFNQKRIAKVLEVAESMTEPIPIPENADCTTLILLATRAGAQVGLRTISVMVEDTNP